MSKEGYDPGPRPKADLSELAAGKELRREAVELVEKISPYYQHLVSSLDRGFYDGIKKRLEVDTRFVPSRNQVFWLRDILEKVS